MEKYGNNSILKILENATLRNLFGFDCEMLPSTSVPGEDRCGDAAGIGLSITANNMHAHILRFIFPTTGQSYESHTEPRQSHIQATTSSIQDIYSHIQIHLAEPGEGVG